MSVREIKLGVGTAWNFKGEHKPEDAYFVDLLSGAILAGYRFVDTAYSYGTEKIVGKAIEQAAREGVSRCDLFVQTKFYPVMPYDGNTLKQQFEESMENLGLDYLDSYLIHQPVPRYSEKEYTERNISVWRAMEGLVHNGKVKHIGVSNFLERHILQIKENCEIEPEINQIEINPQFQQIGLSDYCKKHGMSVQGWGSLSVTEEGVKSLLSETAQLHNTTWAKVALKWSMQLGNIPICSSTNPEHLKDNLDIDFDLSEEDMERIRSCNSAAAHRQTWWYPRQQMY